MTNSFIHKNAILRNLHTKSVCFIGHRRLAVTAALTERLTAVIYELVVDGVTNFLFGSHSQFDELCYQIVTNLQKEFPQIRRVHYCAPYENYTAAGVNGLYEQEIDCPAAFAAAGNAYLARNLAMLDACDLAVFYYDADYLPPRRRRRHALTTYQPKSGTAVAYQYALTHHKTVINVAD